ncbi:TPA: putative sulfate exporter family transporter [Staphylococcus aureus]|nr:putative sulfate exporter family transporter [Staphylococcus aureus]
MKSITQPSFMKGIMFTFIIAMISYILAEFPILHTIGALAIAIIFAMIYRQVIGYPEHIRPGITFASKRLLKFAIILYGLKLNMGDILGKGWKLLLIDIIVIIFSISLTLILNQIIKGNKDISILLGIGTGVCGAAAIAATAATAPILKSKEKDIAISVGIIALIGTIFALIYTAIKAIFNIPTITYGAWTGISLHEIAHVVLAADIGGPEAMTFALLGKLGRVFLLIPLSIVLILYMRYKSHSSQVQQKVDIPYFLIGFILMACVNTFIPIPSLLMNIINVITTVCMLMAMVALGLNIVLKEVISKALKPFIVICITSICLSGVTLLVTSIMFK